MDKTREKIILLFVIAVLFMLAYDCYQSPQLSSNLRGKFTEIIIPDSIMVDNRDMGNINLCKFIEKVKKIGKYEIKKTNDSVDFIIKSDQDNYFFYKGENSFKELKKTKNLPINIKDKGGFSAKIIKENNIEYIKIPYHILFSIVEYTENTSKNKNEELKLDKNERITIKNVDNIPINGKKLIQTEGFVKQNAFEIIKNKKISGSNYEQIKFLWKNTKDNWIYISDPDAETDTWRSAEETIEDYYYLGNNSYAGDCDDFAILMASFARQVGFKSRIVVVFNNKGEGHAYSEFFVPNKDIDQMEEVLGSEINADIKDNGGLWVNMDWFSERMGGKPFSGKRRVLKLE